MSQREWKRWPLRDELFAQRQVVVDLAVEGDGDLGVVAAVHRLGAVGRQIDDRQAPVAERDRAFEEVAVAVRAAVGDDVSHPAQQRLATGVLRRTLRVAIYEATDAAHRSSEKPYRERMKVKGSAAVAAAGAGLFPSS